MNPLRWLVKLMIRQAIEEAVAEELAERQQQGHTALPGKGPPQVNPVKVLPQTTPAPPAPATQPTADQPPVKRGPGRPRKNPPLLPAPEQNGTTPTPNDE